MKTKIEKNQSLFRIPIDRLKSFYSCEDLNEFNDSENPWEADFAILLYKRNEWYQNYIKEVIKETKNKSLCKTMVEDFKHRIINWRRLNEKYDYTSSFCITKEDKKLIHSHLRFLENFLSEVFLTDLSGERRSIGKNSIVNLRGIDYPTLEITQKIILVHYLSTNMLFPSHNPLTTTSDQYIVSLAVIFNNSGTNIAKKQREFKRKLKEYKSQNKSLDSFSPALYKDAILVKKWLQVMGLNKIATNLDNELLS